MFFLSFCKSSLLGEADLLTFGEFCFTMIWRADIDATKDVEILNHWNIYVIFGELAELNLC